MLHIHNGDSSANTAKESSLPGEHFAWREALIEGPTPSGVDDTRWRKLRAQHLSEAYGVGVEECEHELLAQQQKLSTLHEHEEVVLWFEHDLFCQVTLIYLLDRFANHDLGNTTLSLVCIGDYPGRENFRGLGELNAEELSSLFPRREKITAEQLSIGTRAWQTYCSRDPREIESLLATYTAALPFLAEALKAHLARFPSMRNGLGAIENTALQLLSGGPQGFDDLFNDFAAAKSIYGFGDAQFWLALKRMSDTDQALVDIDTTKSEHGLDHRAAIRITDLGRSVLDGEADFVMLNGIDHWLGGVYLNDEKNLWRWDGETVNRQS